MLRSQYRCPTDVTIIGRRGICGKINDRAIPGSKLAMVRELFATARHHIKNMYYLQTRQKIAFFQNGALHSIYKQCTQSNASLASKIHVESISGVIATFIYHVHNRRHAKHVQYTLNIAIFSGFCTCRGPNSDNGCTNAISNLYRLVQHTQEANFHYWNI